MIGLWIALGVLVVGLVWFIATYNRFVGLRQHIRESWADIDVELKRRHELIPNLVETVKGYAAHERGIFDDVARLRSQAMQHVEQREQLGTDESALMKAVGRLIAVAEGYPELKSDRNFLSLQEELSNTEDRIAASRRFFNANVREYQQLRGQVPTNLVAGMFGFGPEAFFELDSDAERVVPRVGVRE
ncbi:MAG: LemA family protein [Phycisphaerales bacterium]|nr:LemA family protein [Phycisphaerales bacterium]